MLSCGFKLVTLFGGTHKARVKDKARTNTIGTIFGYRKGRVSLAIQEDTHTMPMFLIQLPMHTSAMYREMASEVVRIGLESESKKNKKLLDEAVWGVYCNGRKVGYSIRRKQMSEEEASVMQVLRGVSMGAGVLPSDKENGDGEMMYMRATFERVVGSMDSQAFYMINPDHDSQFGPELSIFVVRLLH